MVKLFSYLHWEIGYVSPTFKMESSAISLRAALQLGVITMPRRLLAKDVQSTETPNLVNANNAFALELLKTVSKEDPQKNQFFSPFSIQSALTIALEGARNQTAWQMGEALQYPESLKQQGGPAWNMTTLRKEFLSISKRLQPDDSQKAQELRKKVAKLRADLKKANEASEQLSRSNKYQEANAKYQEASKLADQINAMAKQVDQYELRNANSLWIDASFKISPKYQSIIAENYRPTEAIAANFREQPEVERKRINDWVATQTEDKIRDIVPEGTIDKQTRLVIANAIYFKGTWSEPFAENATQTAEFTGRDASTKSVSMMRASQYESAKYAAFNADGSRFETPKMVDEDFDEVKVIQPTMGIRWRNCLTTAMPFR